MDSPHPIRLHFSPDKPALVLLNGLMLEPLTSFELQASVGEILRTHYGVIGAFPKQVSAPEDALSNQVYPLRVSVGATTDDIHVIYMSRPIGFIKSIYVKLFIHETSGEPKFVFRLLTYQMPDELRDALLELGVEVIIEPLLEQSSER